MNQPGWKLALIGSVMAFGSQTALANKPLPCPTTSPLVDTIGLVQGATKQKVENRLRALDAEKHHQVVVVTVNNLEEYGYGSIEEMANAVGMGCKVGYRGENTGVVVLYTKTPSLYRIENAGTERYITDADSKRILGHSKSEGVCKKEDVSCRLDDITNGLDTIIRKSFTNQQAVQDLKDSTQKFDVQKAEEKSSELLNSLGLGAVILVVLGGGFVGGKALVKRNRRKVLKKQIFELSIRFKTEKAKYPLWFLKRHTLLAEIAMRELESFSDDQLDNIVQGGRQKIFIDEKIATVMNAIGKMEIEFKEITEKVQTRTSEVSAQISKIGQLQASLQQEGFKFGAIDIPTIHEGSNPDETLSLLDRASQSLGQSSSRLNTIPGFYRSIRGLDERVQAEFVSKKSELVKVTNEYAAIYGTAKPIDLAQIEKQVARFIQDFQATYKEKDIGKLEILSGQAESLLSPVSRVIDSMRQDIRWYNEIPSKVTARQKQLQGIQVKPEYADGASKYAQKTGKRTFSSYNMGATLLVLQGLLTFITDSHSQKRNLAEIDKKLREFDSEYSNMKEFMGLGAALVAIIAEEIANAERAERRRIEEQRRREEAEARRRRQDEEDEERRQRQRDDDSRSSSSSYSSSSSSSWDSGGGGGFSGGGATDD